jgi:hypothetical protein
MASLPVTMRPEESSSASAIGRFINSVPIHGPASPSA